MVTEATNLEKLDTKDLSTHTADEVLDEILTAAESRYSFRDFYHRWEHQQWQATEIDLSRDAADWQEMPDVVKDAMLDAMAGFYQGEESVTRNLAPLLLAAPTIEQEIFLSTQIVDEARHLVLFERFWQEVVGAEGDSQVHLEQLRPEYSKWYRTLFFDGPLGLDGRSDKVRENPRDPTLYVEAITLYHTILEAGLALLGQRFLLDLCRAMEVLPGFNEGFMAVTRDESRHVGGGVRILREMCERDPKQKETVMRVHRESVPYVVRLVHDPDEDFDLDLVNYVPQEYIQSPQESHRYSLNHIMKRLKAVGIDVGEINELGEMAWGEFEKAVAEWEERTGDEHFARSFPDQHAKGPARVA